MRFLGIGKDGSLGEMYLKLAASGHEVKACIEDPLWHNTLGGMLRRIPDWRAELDWVREDGIVLFEAADHGELQDQLRKDGFRVIGGSAIGDKMENDRDFGQACMRQAGMKTAESRDFSDFSRAIALIRQRPRRYVFKLSGSGYASSSNVVGMMEDGSDIAALLERHRTGWAHDHPPRFILMDHISGVEVGVGGYFNGQEFLDAVVMDWEHKKFFNGDLGELTGEMGTLLTYRNSGPLFERTLAKMTAQLREGGYVGYINLNTIMNQDGIWPLEFTCRFGYPGAAICSTLHNEGWDVLFRRMVTRECRHYSTKPGFAVGVVLTVPPFPQSDSYTELCKGLPLSFHRPFAPADMDHLHMSEIERKDGQFITSGGTGSLMAVTGTGETVEQAQAAAYGRCANIAVQDVRYRTDIGMRFLTRDRELMREWGLWPMDAA